MSEGSTPREFGEALKAIRTDAGVTLEAISERTKIAGRILVALERGEFARLPSQVFARMFLRQYLETIGQPQGEWVTRFDNAWQLFLASTRPQLARVAAPRRHRRVGPWVVGLALVAVAVAAVLWVEKRNRGPETAAAPPSPTSVLPHLSQMAATSPTPPAPPSPTASPTPDQRTMVIRTGASPCWVEVRVAGERTLTRLLAPASTWEVQAGGNDVDVMLGDAGAASIEYLGRALSPAGHRGEVARLHFAAGAPTGNRP